MARTARLLLTTITMAAVVGGGISAHRKYVEIDDDLDRLKLVECIRMLELERSVYPQTRVFVQDRQRCKSLLNIR
jgi:hypothetical protein